MDGRATGGLSQETWLATITSSGRSQPVVLRLPTLASGPRSIVTQRIALQQAHAAGLPVPGLIASDDGSDNPFGAPYLVMERAVGEIPRGWNEIAQPRRREIAVHSMQVLAALQRVDPAAATDAGLRRPKVNPAAEELAYYRRRFAHLGVSLSGTVEVAFRWLEANLPSGDDLVIVHNDYRMGNFVVSDDQVTAILDWELAAIGHPLADLTWCFISVWEIVDVDQGEMFDAYLAAGGRPFDPVAVRWYTAMGYLRLLYYGLSGGAAFAAGDLHDLRQPPMRLLAPLRIDRLLRIIDGDVLVS